MSSAAAEEEEKEQMMFCASCGTAGGDDVKLRKCACHLVKYCSVKCQKEHRARHKKECKERLAKLRDDLLFTQPESSDLGDCPICFLPLPPDPTKFGLFACCSKQICVGCDLATRVREIEGRLPQKCPFCRMPRPSTQEEEARYLMNRVASNDPIVLSQIGTELCNDGDYERAYEYHAKAAASGDAIAHYELAFMYRDGNVVEKSEKKVMYHLEEAAIAGHLCARYLLGCVEEEKGKIRRAGRHWIIAAKLGDDESLQKLKDLYKAGNVSKEDFAVALRGHHAAIKATQSPQRDEAAEFLATRTPTTGVERGMTIHRALS